MEQFVNKYFHITLNFKIVTHIFFLNEFFHLIIEFKIEIIKYLNISY